MPCVVKYSYKGVPQLVWKPLRMPRLPDNFLDTAVYIYDSLEDAKSGKAAGGSGFLISIPWEGEDGEHVYVVTNHHVISGANSKVVRLNSPPPLRKTNNATDAQTSEMPTTIEPETFIPNWPTAL